LHGCPYCYARCIATRFGGAATNIPHVLDQPFVAGRKVKPYPFGFTPTFHKYRLDEYADKKGRNIFVCSMADLFGEWVPDEWVEEVFSACERAPQHNYLFLTKNPERYLELDGAGKLPHKDNMWYGASTTDAKQLTEAAMVFGNLPASVKTFLSIEPIQEDITTTEAWDDICVSHHVDWVIIGAETGNRKDKVVPERTWIWSIVSDCEDEIPVFVKSSLADIWGPIHEFPEQLRKK
jgi:protein gp37